MKGGKVKKGKVITEHRERYCLMIVSFMETTRSRTQREKIGYQYTGEVLKGDQNYNE